MANGNIEKYLEMVTLQIAAEAFFSEGPIDSVLQTGNKVNSRLPEDVHGDFLPGGDEGIRYSVIAHQEMTLKTDHPGQADQESGFSATLFRDNHNGEYTLSFRSTEFDREIHDVGDTHADLEIGAHGWAFDQIRSMEEFWAGLKSGNLQSGIDGVVVPDISALTAFGSHVNGGSNINVTGYSLGGNLAQAFTELHAGNVAGTYIFNAAGTGTAAGGLNAVWNQYLSVFNDLASTASYSGPMPLALAAEQIGGIFGDISEIPAHASFTDPRHLHAINAISADVTGASLFGDSRVEYGSSQLINDIWASTGEEEDILETLVADIGVRHGKATPVWYEDQPMAYWESFFDGEPGSQWGTGHSIVLLQDSLSLMTLFETLQPSISIEDLGRIFEKSSDTSHESLERAANALASFVGVSPLTGEEIADDNSQFTDMAFRNNFHNKLQEIRESQIYDELRIAGEQGSLQFEQVDITSLADRSKNSYSAFLTLYHLLPFELSLDSPESISQIMSARPDLAQVWQADHELSAQERSQGLATFSDQYLQDRALFLQSQLASSESDSGHGNFTTPSRFVDLERGLSLAGDGLIPPPNNPPDFFESARERYIFGSQAGDTPGNTPIIASANDDSLYGLGGNDVIDGLAGDDYIEGGADNDIIDGGAGSDILHGGDGDDHITGGADVDFLVGGAGADTFHWSAGDGNDVIGDFDDGGDRIQVNGVDLASLDFRPVSGDSPYYRDSNHPGITLHYDGGALTIDVGNGADAGAITVGQFDAQAADYGITLGQPVPTAAPPTELIVTKLGRNEDAGETDWHAYDRHRFQGDLATLPIYFDGQDVEGYTGGIDLIGMDRFEGGPFDDFLAGDAGTNRLTGLSGDDLIRGRDDADWLFGGEGSDTIEGGTGADFILGDTLGAAADNFDPDNNQDAFYLPQILDVEGDFNTIDGGDGEDYISGGRYGDLIAGGDGADYTLGGTGHDSLAGGAGNDMMYGDSAFELRLEVDDDSMVIAHWEILFADGTDEIGQYNDELRGGAGHDTLWGELGDDTLFGGAGNDWLGGDRALIGTFFDEEIPAHENTSPVLVPLLHGNDRLYGGAGDDSLLGHGGDDILSGGTGSDALVGAAGDDAYLLRPGDGADTVQDAEGVHTLVFQGFQADSLDIVFQGEMVSVGAATDWLSMDREEWQNTRIALNSPDNLVERSRFDTYYLNAGGGLLLGVAGERGITEADRDAIVEVDDTNPEAPRLVPGPDATNLSAEADHFESGNARMEIRGGQQGPLRQTLLLLELAAGIAEAIARGDSQAISVNLPDQISMDWLGFGGNAQGGAGNDHITGGNGADELSGFGGRDWLEGRGGDDELDGGAFADLLEGGTGADTLYGGGGNDELVGGAGDDHLAGGFGSDTYRFEPGDGTDTLEDPDSFRLALQGVSSQSIALTYTGLDSDDFRISYGGGSILSLGNTDIRDLSTVTVGGLVVPLVQRSNVTAGHFYSTRGDDVFETEDGNDTIFTDSWGNNVYRFASGDGDDTIRLEYIFGPGRMGDIRFSGDVDLSDLRFDFNPLVGDATIYYGDDQIFLDGGLFNSWDNALGLFTLSSESDPTQAPTIRLAEGSSGWLRGSFGTDHIIGDDISQWIRPGYGDDVIEARGGGDLILLSEHYLPSGRHTGGIGKKQIYGQGGDDTIRAPLHQGLTFHYNPGDGFDVIEYDWSYSNSALQYPYSITYDSDSDTVLYQPMGEDVLAFGPGLTLDDLSFTRVDNTLNIGVTGVEGGIRIDNFFLAYDVEPPAGGVDLSPFTGEGFFEDLLTHEVILGIMPDTPVGKIRFADNTEHDMASVLSSRLVEQPILPGITVMGTENADSLEGGPDIDDVIQALGGNDVILDEGGTNVVDGGPGNDEITLGGNNTVFAGAGDDRVTLNGGVNQVEGGAGEDTIEWADGGNDLNGGDGNDTFLGTGGFNAIDAGAGDDLIELTGGANAIHPGAGNDNMLLHGGYNLAHFGAEAGLNILAFTIESGASTIIEVAPGIGPDDIELDALSFPDGSLISMSSAHNDAIWWLGAIDPDTLSPLNDRTVSKIRFADGTVFSELQILQMVGLVEGDGDGTDGPDNLNGTAGPDTINGGPGDDTLNGNAGNDTLFGGAGNDLLVGGTGSDTLHGQEGDDTFTVTGVDDGYDRVVGGEGFDVLHGDDTNNLLGLSGLSVADSLEQIDGEGGSFDIVSGNAEANLLDFSNTELINVLAIIGDDGDDTITGSRGDDFILGNVGNDTLDGGAGNDTLLGNAGDDLFVTNGIEQGYDIIEGGGGFDTLRAGDGNDLLGLRELTPSHGLERIDGGAGIFDVIGGNDEDNTLDFSDTELVGILAIIGNAGDDTVTGSSGNDYILGGADDDTLNGGGGNDTLSGGTGNDTYLFALGGGSDTISDDNWSPASADLVRLTDIAHDQLWFSRQGDDLVMDLVGSSDRLTFDQWYLADGSRVDAIVAGEQVLQYNQVDQLVNAMAAFATPEGVGSVIPQDVRQQLEPVLTTVWQAA